MHQRKDEVERQVDEIERMEEGGAERIRHKAQMKFPRGGSNWLKVYRMGIGRLGDKGFSRRRRMSRNMAKE